MLPLAAGDARATVDPDGGGRLAALSYAGFDLLTEAGCFVMAPWAGRTGYGTFTFEGVAHALPVPEEHAPHAIHGTVRQRPWIVESADSRQVRLTVGLGPDWPWDGLVRAGLSLDPDSIRLELSVHSRTDRLPGGPRLAPVVRRPRQHRGGRRRPAAARRRPPPHRRPPRSRRCRIGWGPLDDCFEDVQWPARLTWDEPAVELLVEATGCDHVVVFNEIEGTTCVEPQTGPPDALRTGEAPSSPPANRSWRRRRGVGAGGEAGGDPAAWHGAASTDRA